MADPWDILYGPEAPATDWTSNLTFSMPEQGDLLKWNPSLTGDGLRNLMDLGSIGKAVSAWTPPAMPNLNLAPNARGNPWLDALYQGPSGPAAGAAPRSVWSRAPGTMMDFIKQNPAAFLALLGAGGAGIAGAVKGSQRAKLPGEVQDLVKRATAPAAPDAYENAELDRQMRRDLGPGWETSTPGIQAKAQQQYLRQKGDQGAAAAALGPVGSLYAYRDAQKAQEQEALFRLASTLGVLGLGGLGAFGGLGYAG